jgi:riboflavin biosynthesis pyrimidine reductase
MMTEPVLQLYPQPARELPLHGLYLGHNLRQYGREGGRAWIFSNFVQSLDGRIAIAHPTRGGQMVPKSIANERDWRLFQELMAQCDVVISSGRYLRDVADGRAQELFQINDPKFADLREWREKQGLAPYPDIVVVSRSLDFPIPEVLTQGGRRVTIFTNAGPDAERVAELERQAGEVIVAGREGVKGDQLAGKLAGLGYQVVFAASGPKILHMLLSAGVLDRLYLTQTGRILGGQPATTIVEGPLFDAPYDMRLGSLYYDPHAPEGLGQLLMSYDVD